MAKINKITAKRKPVKHKKAAIRKVTAAKARGLKPKPKVSEKPKRAKPQKAAAKPARHIALKKLKKYSPRSRFSSYSIGDRVQFGRIKNWESELALEKIVGIVVDKIDDKQLGLKFIEVRFDLREYLPFAEQTFRTRRFVVK